MKLQKKMTILLDDEFRELDVRVLKIFFFSFHFQILDSGKKLKL